jgi:hypothetical protein
MLIGSELILTTINCVGCCQASLLYGHRNVIKKAVDLHWVDKASADRTVRAAAIDFNSEDDQLGIQSRSSDAINTL